MKLRFLTILSITLALAVARGQDGPRFIDLMNAKAVTTHDNNGRCPARVVIDGDEDTVWSSGGHDHRARPANVFITLPEPASVAGLEVLTDDSKGFVRLTRLEVYAAVGGGWALLGSIRDNDQLRFTVRLTPAWVQRLRLRVCDTARPDHAWPRIHEVKLIAGDPNAPAAKLEPTPVPDETRTEEAFVAKALGNMPKLPETKYDPKKGYLWYVRSFADTLIEHGTDRYGKVHGPMFVSILDCRDHRHPGYEIPPIKGQRQNDRALFGGNLQHDVPLLVALGALSGLTGDAKYRQAARAYLAHFLSNCTRTKTGLWPWGEHAHWDFYKDEHGHATHEHLGLAPRSFWELAWTLNQDAVLGEANGCINHVVDLKTFDFNRHADISNLLPEPRREGTRFLDFPRHGGFYLYLWAFAYSKTGNEKYLGWVKGMLDHFEANTHPKSGLMRMATKDRNREVARLGSSLSTALTLLEAAPLLGDSDQGNGCTRMGRALIGAIASLPHKLEERKFVSSCAYAGPVEKDKLRWREPGYTAHYGKGFLGTSARMWAHAYELTGSESCLDIARAMAQYYAEAGGVPEAEHTRAQVFGTALNLMLDLHQHDRGKQWLPAANAYAQQAIKKLYYNGLFRGATGLHYYESELWVSNLVHALLRLHSLVDDRDVTVEALHFAR